MNGNRASFSKARLADTARSLDFIAQYVGNGIRMERMLLRRGDLSLALVIKVEIEEFGGFMSADISIREDGRKRAHDPELEVLPKEVRRKVMEVRDSEEGVVGCLNTKNILPNLSESGRPISVDNWCVEDFRRFFVCAVDGSESWATANGSDLLGSIDGRIGDVIRDDIFWRPAYFGLPKLV